MSILLYREKVYRLRYAISMVDSTITITNMLTQIMNYVTAVVQGCNSAAIKACVSTLILSKCYKKQVWITSLF